MKNDTKNEIKIDDESNDTKDEIKEDHASLKAGDDLDADVKDLKAAQPQDDILNEICQQHVTTENLGPDISSKLEMLSITSLLISKRRKKFPNCQEKKKGLKTAGP